MTKTKAKKIELRIKKAADYLNAQGYCVYIHPRKYKVSLNGFPAKDYDIMLPRLEDLMLVTMAKA